LAETNPQVDAELGSALAAWCKDVFPGETFQGRQVQLAPSQRAIFYSDGADDTLSAGGPSAGQDGEALARTLLPIRHLPVEQVRKDVIDWCIEAMVPFGRPGAPPLCLACAWRHANWDWARGRLTQSRNA